jgi:hypothetical protein
MRVILTLLLCVEVLISSLAAAPGEAGQQLAELNEDLARLANSKSLSEADKKTLVDAFKEAVGQKMSLSAPIVRDNVSVHAVLLPYEVCSRVFGKETAEHYAAIQVIIANRSDQANLIIQSLFADLSAWLLAGASFKRQDTLGDIEPWEAAIRPGALGSVEYRGVRGQLLTRRPYTARNTLIRVMKLAGSIAAAYQFSLSEQGFLRGIAAFNGEVIPGTEAFWPDDTIEQLNRISDVGFQVNKVVAQQSAEIVVAFYPLKRFLPGGFREIFKREPSLFFAPASMAVDTRTRELVKKYAPDVLELVNLGKIRKALHVLDELQGVGEDQRKSQISKYDSDTQEGLKHLKLLNSISLNAIRIGIGGIMAVDMDSLPPAIESITIDNDGSGIWAEAGTFTGVARGRYLQKSTLEVADSESLGITGELLPDDASDTSVKIRFTTTKPIPSGAIISLRLKKNIIMGGKSRTVYSAPYLIRPVYTIKEPTIESVKRNASVVTVQGANFFDSGQFALRLVPSQSASAAKIDVPKKAYVRKPDNIVVDLTKVSPPLAAGCWSVEVEAPPYVPKQSRDMFSEPLTATIDNITKSGSRVVVVGKGFFEPANCNSGTLSFTLAAEGKEEQAVKGYKRESPTQVSFDVPEGANGKWTVRLYIDKQNVAERDIQF